MVLPLANLVCLLALAADPRPLPEVVADLGSTDHARREDATIELMSTRAYTLAQIEEALKQTTLTAEQRFRLEQAGLHLFKQVPHGALGVTFTDARNATAEIAEVRKGFPSAATLKAGDIITHIDGVPVTASANADPGASSVRALVISHDPGDEVPVIVQRDGQPVNLKVKFGDFNDLNKDVLQANPGFIMPRPGILDAEYHNAWRHRVERRTGASPAAIDATALRGRRDAGWSRPGVVDVIDASTASRANAGEVPSVVAGANPDQARQVDRVEQRLYGRRENAGFRAFNNGFVVAGGLGDLTAMTDRELAEERMRLSQWVNTVRMMVAQQEITRGQRNEFAELQRQQERQLDLITREIDKRKAARLEAALEPAPAQPSKAPEQAPDPMPGKP